MGFGLGTCALEVITLQALVLLTRSVEPQTMSLEGTSWVDLFHELCDRM